MTACIHNVFKMTFLNRIKSVAGLITNKFKYGLLTNISISSVLEGNNYIGRFTTLRGYVGRYSYIGNKCIILGKIGRYTSIAGGVKVINGRHPITSPFVSTCPLFYSTKSVVGKGFVKKNIFDEFQYAENKFPIVIGNDCWIGANALIIENIHINDGAVVLAGAVVTKDVPAYAIVGGVPAKVISYRYDKDTIKKLLQFQWWNKNNAWIKENSTKFSDITDFLESIK